MSEDPVHISEPLVWTLSELLDKERKRRRKLKRKFRDYRKDMAEGDIRQSNAYARAVDRSRAAEEVMAQLLQAWLDYPPATTDGERMAAYQQGLVGEYERKWGRQGL